MELTLELKTVQNDFKKPDSGCLKNKDRSDLLPVALVSLDVRLDLIKSATLF